MKSSLSARPMIRGGSTEGAKLLPALELRACEVEEALSSRDSHFARLGFNPAQAETINGLYKAGVIHRRDPWRSFEAFEFATLEWVDWFNNRRLLEPIGNIPPGSRGKLLRHAARAGHGSMPQTKQPPVKPGRFSFVFAADLILG